MGKIVYFLGSGASKAAFGLPCMKGFFRPDDLTGPDYPNLATFINKRFPGTAPICLNIEDVITCLELNLDRVGSFGRIHGGHVLDARREFDRLVVNHLSISGNKSSDLHESLMGRDIAGFDCKDTVITVNYDLAVDRMLFACSPEEDPRHYSLLERTYYLLAKPSVAGGPWPSVSPGEMKMGLYLKLHGSLDWFYCPNQDCPHHREFFATWMGPKLRQFTAGDLCNMCGASLVNVLVPPTMMKSFAQFPKLGLLWSLAHRELNLASRIVIFGLSFAPSDYYLRWLFRSAITDRTDPPEMFNINTDGGTSAEMIKELTGICPVNCETVDQYRCKV